jgi:hypothetical protein
MGNFGSTRSGVIAGLIAACALLACEEEKAPAPKPAVSVQPVPTPAAPVAEAPKPKADKERPEKIDTTLTDARRAAIESKYAPTKGFLLAKDLEDKLKNDKSLKDQKTALAAFDKLAKGKWVLFSGNAVNLTAQGFDMGIVYTKPLPQDTTGMSRQWFPVTVSDVEGYKQEAFKVGDMCVTLVKYAGGGKASPGYELVATGVWQ